jgi:hypothetical protein
MMIVWTPDRVVMFSDSSDGILLSNAVVKNAREYIHMLIFHMFSS